MNKNKLVVLLVISFVIFAIHTVRSQSKPLKVGDAIPSFALKDQNGNDFNIDTYRGKKIMVIYFYPKDDTPGCTKEACSFRDTYESFTDLDVLVIGISADNIASHKKFEEKYKLPFTLLADVTNTVRKQFGVSKDLMVLPGRVTFVVNKQGVISSIFNNLKAEQHVEKSLEIIKKWNAKKD